MQELRQENLGRGVWTVGGSDNFHDQFSKPFVEIVQKIFKIDNLSCNRVWGGGLDESDQAPTAFPPGSLCCRCPQVVGEVRLLFTGGC